MGGVKYCFGTMSGRYINILAHLLHTLICDRKRVARTFYCEKAQKRVVASVYCTTERKRRCLGSPTVCAMLRSKHRLLSSDEIQFQKRKTSHVLLTFLRLSPFCLGLSLSLRSMIVGVTLEFWSRKATCLSMIQIEFSSSATGKLGLSRSSTKRRALHPASNKTMSTRKHLCLNKFWSSIRLLHEYMEWAARNRESLNAYG